MKIVIIFFIFFQRYKYKTRETTISNDIFSWIVFATLIWHNLKTKGFEFNDDYE